MNSIYITGCSGFIGVNLSKFLTINNHSIVGVSRFVNSRKGVIDYSNIEKELIRSGKAVIHLAAKAHDLKKVSNPSDYYEANLELTKFVFDAFLKSKASVFIFMSTVKAVADQVEGVLTEESLSNPKTHYGIAKHLAEEYILNIDIPKDKRVYILRPCMIHGPGNKGNLNLLYKIVGKGLPWPLGSFENQRSFLSVENLCFVINELLENQTIPSGVYQIADDGVISINALIELISDVLGKKNKIWRVQIKIIKAIAKIGDTFSLPLNTERLQKLTENYVVSNEKIIKAIGKQLPLTLKSGLLLTINSFKINT